MLLPGPWTKALNATDQGGSDGMQLAHCYMKWVSEPTFITLLYIALEKNYSCVLQGQKVNLSLSLSLSSSSSLSIPLSFPLYPPFSLSPSLPLSLLQNRLQLAAINIRLQPRSTWEVYQWRNSLFWTNQSTTACLYCLSDKLRILLNTIHTHTHIVHTRTHALRTRQSCCVYVSGVQCLL